MSNTDQETQALLFSKINNGKEYAIQIFLEDHGWSSIWPGDLQTLKDARNQAVKNTIHTTCRVVKVSRYMSGDTILVHEIVQVYQKRKS